MDLSDSRTEPPTRRGCSATKTEPPRALEPPPKHPEPAACQKRRIHPERRAQGSVKAWAAQKEEKP